MKEKQSFIISEIKKDILESNSYTCQRCGNQAIELAHRISQNKTNIKKYGKEIIHHEYNLVSSCHECNSYFNIGFNDGKIEKLIYLIKNVYGLSAKDVTNYIEG